MHPIYDKRAVSHIVATLMLVTVTVAASLVTCLFVMNYVQLSTTKSGKAVEIQTMNIANGRLTVYLQNVGQRRMHVFGWPSGFGLFWVPPLNPNATQKK
jgi:FlaG/FlaF family flagellin (archaellin)